MRSLLIVAMMLVVLPANAVTLPQCAGVVRVFGDATSWMTSAFVVGDGSWVVTTADAVTEKITTGASQPVRTVVFISAYTGEARQCEIKVKNTELNVALLKLPASGLPAAPFAKPAEMSKAAYGTMGQLMGGDPQGNRWATQVFGVTREKSGETYRIAVGEWSAKKAFVTDIGNYKWLFLSDMSERNAPAASMVARETAVVGMYLNRFVLTGGGSEAVYGRCAMGGEITRFLSKNGLDTSVLYDPPAPTVKADETATHAFQLQATIYSLLGAGRPTDAVVAAAELAKLRPGDAQAQMVHGIALTGAGKFDDAIKAFDESAKLDPKLPTLRLNRALALVGLKKRTEAETELTKAVEESPSDVRAVAALADFYLGDEKTYSKSLTYATKAVQMAPNSPAMLLQQARAQKRLKDFPAAIKSAESAAKLASNWPPVQFALGSIYEESGDMVNAEKAYRKLVELQPKDPSALLTLAAFLADNGKPVDALDMLIKLRELNPPKEILDAAKVVEDKIKGAKG